MIQHKDILFKTINDNRSEEFACLNVEKSKALWFQEFQEFSRDSKVSKNFLRVIVKPKPR